MNTQQVARKIRLSDTRASWEDQATSEVAAGKLEVMEKFFTPLPHCTGRRAAKERAKEEASWDGVRDKYYKEFISSSSTSSSPWSSESNFRTQARFSGYNSQASHSRSCNDLSVAKARQNEDRRNFSVKQKDASRVKKASRDGSERLSPGIQKAGPNMKSHSGHVRDVELNKKSEREDKQILKNRGRRARSMEALAEKETRKREGKDGKGRRVTEEKQKFSRFLDEITIQVLSPSNLNSLGIKERQNLNKQDQWKSSSTDSSSSRGKKSQHNSVEQQEVRRKGRTVSATRAKVNVETSGIRRSRDMSTSPDSVSSATWHRGERESSSALTHQQSRINHRHSQEKERKDGNNFEQMGMEKKHVLSGGGNLKGKTQYTDKVQTSELVSAPISKEHLTTSTAWWGETGGSIVSQQLQKNMEHLTDPSRRMKDTFSVTQSHNQVQDTDPQSSSQYENLEQEKDSLNWKITELLDHLVQAQSTICALEKLNVSSLLHHLPADMLESIKVSNKSDDHIHTEANQEFKPLSAICSEASHLNIHSDNLQYNREESKVDKQPAPTMTAFTPLSPRQQRSFPVLHTLYTSTESECSLEEALPTFKLLSPRFPNLGESFSDDRKDDENSDSCEIREGHKVLGGSIPSLAHPSLLPTHRTPHHNLLARASSSDSSGDDHLINWGEVPTQQAQVDYHSAQKILDTLLGLTTPADRTNIFNSENIGEFPFGYVPKSGVHHHSSGIPPSNTPKDVIPRSDSKLMPTAGMDRNEFHSLERPSQPKNSLCRVHSPLSNLTDNSNQRPHSTDSKIPLFPSRGCLFPEAFADVCPHLNSIGEVGFRPVGKQESSSQHKSEGSLSPSPLPKPVPPVVSPSHHSIPFVLRSPSGTESIMRSWDDQNQCHEWTREKKSRKTRTVTFNTMNDSHPIQSQVTVRSKFMSNRDQGDQGQGENPSVDSTLL